MSLRSNKLDSKVIQDILVDVYEQSQRDDTWDAQEVVKMMVVQLQSLLQDAEGSK